MNRTMIQSLRSPRAQRGLTLVEILVAITLSLLLMAGTIQIFLASKQAYRTEDALSRVQENGRFAMGFLATDIRKAGYTGCLPQDAVSAIEVRLNNAANYDWDISNLVTGNEATGANTWSPTLPAALSGNVKSGTDVITIRYMASNGVDLVAPFSDSAQLFIDPAVAGLFSDGDIAMVTDCQKGTLFQITNLQPAGGKVDVVHSNAALVPGNDQSHFNNSYGEDAELAVFVTEAFYIKDNNGVPALYRSWLTTTGGVPTLKSQELVEGIQDMQILYGEDTDNDGTANRYVTADNVTDMSKVVSVRISLLARSNDDHITINKQTYHFPTMNAATTTAADYRLRHAFNTTITLRNRVK
ncbi:MAG: PilW family protein [Gammaproteobacteria bacterium]